MYIEADAKKFTTFSAHVLFLEFLFASLTLKSRFMNYFLQ